MTQSVAISHNFVKVLKLLGYWGVGLACGKNLIHLIQSGADKWNAFRDENPESELIMLNGVCLPDAELAHADLHRAFLLASDLRRANLVRARLEGAILRTTNLHESNLRFANMDGADLFSADLSGADLRDASLAATFLKRANLCGADLSTAHGLSSSQIAEAVGDQSTQLPDDLPRPAAWSAKGSQ